MGKFIRLTQSAGLEVCIFYRGYFLMKRIGSIVQKTLWLVVLLLFQRNAHNASLITFDCKILASANIKLGRR